MAEPQRVSDKQPACPECHGECFVMADTKIGRRAITCHGCGGTGEGPKHTIKVSVSRGSVSAEMVCPYNAADQTRPCWPCEGEDGEGGPMRPDDGKDIGCNWKNWFQEGTWDSVHDNDHIATLDVEKAEWYTGQYFMFQVQGRKLNDHAR